MHLQLILPLRVWAHIIRLFFYCNLLQVATGRFLLVQNDKGANKTADKTYSIKTYVCFVLIKNGNLETKDADSRRYLKGI